MQGGDDADDALRSHTVLIFWDISYSRVPCLPLPWGRLPWGNSTPHFPAGSFLCQVLQHEIQHASALSHRSSGLSLYPSTALVLRQEETNCFQAFFIRLCNSYRAPGLADYEDGQEDRRGVYACDRGGGQQLQIALPA